MQIRIAIEILTDDPRPGPDQRTRADIPPNSLQVAKPVTYPEFCKRLMTEVADSVGLSANWSEAT